MIIVSTTAALEQACADLARSEFVTVDTEFIRESTFWPELCLIQMASDDEVYLVDPLADGIDLAAFFALMKDPAVTKVFHSARQDLEIVYQRGGIIPAPLFDTQVAAMVCGFGDSVSYDALVKKITGEQIDKSSRFTDWARRPLSEKQLTYAAADVTHLRAVYRALAAELEREGRAHWLREEMDVLTSPQTYDLHPDDAWTKLKMRVRKPRELAVMQSVAAWRERAARDRNVPRRRVLKDDAIYEIAQQQPKDTEGLGRLRAIPKGWERSNQAAGLVESIAEALALPKEELPQMERPLRAPEGSNAAAELLKVLLRMVAEREAVAAKVLATSDDIDRIVADGEKADVNAMRGWRREVFGDEALALLRGDLALSFQDRRIAAIELE